MEIPQNIKSIIGNKAFNTDNMGKSEANILIFDDKVLKIRKADREAENEQKMFCWLSDKLPVPKLLAYDTFEDKSYLLIEKCRGKVACDEEYMQNPKKLAKLLAKALKLLWSVDISDCASNMSLEHKLKIAAYRVEHGLVEMDDWETETAEKYGFTSPKELLDWLIEHKPKEEFVLSHGDFCLPNVFFDGDKISGYIDLGKCGLADKYCDIAICYRSLKSNFGGVYGKAYEGFDESDFFKELEIEPDFDKIKYYILLDELF